MYLLAVVGGVLHTDQVWIGPAIEIRVLSTDMAVASIARLAFTTVHGIGEVSKVVTACIFIALVASVEAGITRSADLLNKSDW